MESARSGVQRIASLPKEPVRLLLALLISLLCLPALAFTPDELEARLASVEQYRQDRAATNIVEVPAADRRKAASGQVITGVSNGKAYAVGIVNAPIARFWAALNDEVGQRNPAVVHSEIVAGTKCQAGRKVLQVIDIGMFISGRWWIGLPVPNGRIMRNSGGSVRELTWSSSVNAALVTNPPAQKLIAARSPIGHTRGAWFLVALDARNTYVEYFADSDPGAGIPSGLAARMAGGAIKDNFENLTKFANKTTGGPSCPIR